MTLQLSTFPASFAQRRMWFIQQMAQHSTAYNMVVSLQLGAGLDPARLQLALDQLCMHHEALRTSFAVAAGDVVQQIAGSGSVTLEVHDVESRAAFAAVVSTSAATPFRLEYAPLVRAHMGCLADAPPLLALVVHHIVADGVTLQILLGDLRALLDGLACDRPAQLPQASVEYADYAVWQRRSLSGKRLETLTSYWCRRLDSMPELALPRRPRADGTASGNLRGGFVALRISPITSQRLRVLAADARATLFGVLLAGFCAVLGRFSGQRDFGIGIPVNGRNRVELERVAGLFVNSVVFRATLPPDVSFTELVRQTAVALTQDLARQEMPFEQVVDALHVKRAADRNPLFQVMLQLQRASGASMPVVGSHNAATDLMDPQRLSAQLDLSLILFDGGELGVEGGFVFAAELLDAAWVEQLATALGVLLADAAQDPDQPIDRLPLLDPPAREALLSLCRGPQRAWPGATLLHEGLAEMAHRLPNAVAICAVGETISFSALEARAATLAIRLRRAGLGAGDVLALCTPRSIEAIAAMLAALRCGAAYFVIDPAAPPAYRAFLLEDSAARVVAVQPGGIALAAGRVAIELDGTAAAADDAFPAPPVSPSSTAYLIYTSGSTGEPKGVRISHGSAVNHMRWFIEQFDVGPADRILQRTPLSFDASIWEIWVPLLSGATLILADNVGPFDPARLARQVSDNAITVLQVVPSILRVLLPQVHNNELGSLRMLFCGGEALSKRLVRDAQSVCAATVTNLYGPSETTIDATFNICPSMPSDLGGADDQVAIGRPVANTSVYVLDEQLQVLPCGVTGELCIGGDAVGLGYQQRATLTAERFVPDPFRPGGLMFRSGDRARLARDGTLHYLGRNDDQVKLRGFRIELGEIEERLRTHPAVASAAAVVQQLAADDERLVAFASLRSNASATTGIDLLNWLRRVLPVHSVPSAVVLLDAVPQTLHGKIDRAALRRQMPQREAIGRAWQTPSGAFELRVCNCFAQQLAQERVGADDDFFLLGGHSLLMIALCEQLTQELGVPVGVVDVFEFPTPRLLAEALQTRLPHSSNLPRSLSAAGGAA